VVTGKLQVDLFGKGRNNANLVNLQLFDRGVLGFLELMLNNEYGQRRTI
jgi:hypothetical protein